jgi:ribosomal protein L34E
MTVPKNRSNSVRKVFVRTQKGKLAVHYSRRVKGMKHFCALCLGPLTGVSTGRAPNRKFGGNLCSACSSRVLRLRSRVNTGLMQLSDVEVRMLKYVK